MPRITPIDPGTATGKAKQLLDGVQKKLGMAPNIMRVLANSPAALESYLNSSGALAGGVLPTRLREQIALTVAEANGCNYCLAAHTAIGKGAGLSDEEVDDSRMSASPDSKVEAVLRFARELVDKRGWVDEESVIRLRTAGYEDDAIVEIVAVVALNTLTNYVNHVAETEIDFPRVREASVR